MVVPGRVYLYDEGIKKIDFGEIGDFITHNFGGIKSRLSKLKKKAVKTRGLLFDFTATQKEFCGFPRSGDKNACHIILTDALFASFDESKRPHIRSAIYGFPSVISSSGIVEGPAKPREYYFHKQRFTRLGIWDLKEEETKKKLRGRFIDYGDSRMAGVVKGYIAQALFFHITGDPFCGQKSCRLFNAHWQEDLIYSQLKKGKFCRRHEILLKAIRKKVSIVPKRAIV